MAKRVLDKIFRPVYPTPACLITSLAADGTPNIITLAETFNISIGVEGTVTVGLEIVPSRYSHDLIAASGEFTVNIPTADMVREVDRCGTVSGRRHDKFAYSGLTPLPATKVKPPIIAECPVNLECTLIDITQAGDHDLFRGEVVAQHVDDALLDADGAIAIDRLNPLSYVLGQYWSLGRHLADHGFTKKGAGQ